MSNNTTATLAAESALWTSEQIVARYRLHPITARRWMREGRFGAPLKVGRRIFVTDDGVRAYERRHTVHVAELEGVA